MVGGQIANSPKLENFPTIKEIPGADFAIQFMEQVESWGGIIEYDRVTSVSNAFDRFVVSTECSEYCAKAVIVATGVQHKHINVPGEKELLGKGVYYCALCDGPLFAGKEVAVIGDGNTAMQYALALTNMCANVYLLTWMDKFYGDKALENAVRKHDRIIHVPNVSVTGFVGGNELDAIVYADSETGAENDLVVPGVFVAIGQVPNNCMFEHLARLDRQGYFIANEDMSTDTPGFFVAGDCRAKSVRQVATAIADGAVAAVSACKYIDSM